MFYLGRARARVGQPWLAILLHCAAMKDPINFSRMDVLALARQGGAAEGACSEPSSTMTRLLAEACVPNGLQGVHWQLKAELREGPAGGQEPWLQVQADASLALICQRCLERVDVPLTINRWFRFVADEATASAQDDMSEEDVLVLEPRFDALTLIEDELIMAVPLVPLHGECPVAVTMSVADPAFEAAATERPHPFAGLEALAAKKPAG